MKYILMALGLISLGLGIIGIFLPILPTTPLLLLSAGLFIKSSKRLYDWLMNHPKLGSYISNFMIHRSIPMRIKIVSVSMVWITLMFCAIVVSDNLIFSILFIMLAAAITCHILSYKTMK